MKVNSEKDRLKKVALITGAGGAIGRATAIQLAELNFNLFLTDLHEDSCAETAEILTKRFRTSVATGCGDLSREEDVQRITQETKGAFDRLDVVCAIAGVAGPRMSIDALSLSDWNTVISTNLTSMFLCLKYSVSNLISTPGWKSITLMSSTMSIYDVLDGGAAYSASKAAILGLMRAAAFDLAKYKIRVNAVCPGVVSSTLGIPSDIEGINTPTEAQFAARIPLGAVGRAGDVANLIAFLSSEASQHITGSSFLIDGGQTLQSWANAPA